METELTELAWAAGFFDGEGSTSKAYATNDKTKYTKTRLSVPQKYPECLHRFQNALGGLGCIYHRRCDGMHFLSIQNLKGVDTALNLLWPYLSSIKREQATKAGFVQGIIREAKIGRPKGSKNRSKGE